MSMPKARRSSSTAVEHVPSNGRYTRRQQEVLDAAAKLFAERGYEATSIGEIADAVGLLKGSLYYYARSKEGLLFAIIREVQDKGRELVEEVGGTEADLVTQLRELIDAGTRFVVQHREMVTISIRDFRSLSEERQRELQPDRAVLWHYVRRLIASGRDSGVFRNDVDPAIATAAIAGAMNYLPSWYESGRPPRVTRTAAQFSSVLVDGLLPGGGERQRT